MPLYSLGWRDCRRLRKERNRRHLTALLLVLVWLSLVAVAAAANR